MRHDLLLKETVYPIYQVFADEEFLHLPPAWHHFFVKEMRVRSARAALSFLRALPAQVMFHFGMDQKQVRSFLATLLWKLRGFVPKSTLVKRKPPLVAYGAVRSLPR